MQSNTETGWAWFDGVPVSASNSELRGSFVRTFNTNAGRQVLAHLRSATIERRTPPETPECVLRHLEGQRFLVQLIERMANAEMEESANVE